MRARRQSTSRSTASWPLRAARRMALLLLSGLTFVSAMPAVTMAQGVPIARPSPRDSYADHIAEASRRFSVPIAWIRAVMRAESAGDPRAISSKGAMGLMQIMPETWAGLRLRHRLGADPYDPHDNIIAGAGYIRELFDRYGSPGWIAAYNAGPGRYEYSLKGRVLPAETRAYVAIVAPAVGGGDAAGPIVVAAADPLAWTRAPLFIALPDRRPAADPVPAERAPGAATMTSSVRDVSAIEPQSDGLFVPRSGRRNAP
ncbi:MAG: lytic transglycosylase [Rhizobiales bacterium 24-66-13]|jgi:soluble lytic murein transglycosylase-like protein|uniref:Lytic transglycosylase n=2 Tax=Hyphomicrobiales TaxID=356 RepID=A0A1C2DD28_9HYPH|nr:lytic transglycosylase [Mesorhizobium hungaricum]OYZ83021.1 MAG: lytic transglycosylase [Rhizobiales bacterium 24-66-13]OZB12268.1 MAG: lytic transglycosylase [Rhizobiales bacterium 39-66-18]